MNRREALSLSGALAVAALAGCVGGGDGEGDGDGGGGEPSQTSDDPEPADPPTGEPATDDARLAELAAGNATFALDLHAALADGDRGNTFFSPYSISAALAMTVAGAEGTTREEMRAALSYTLGEEIHPAFEDLRTELEARETARDPVDDEEVDAFQLAVANAIWGREGFPFDEDFLALLERHYGAGLREADFAGDPEGERQRINEWVAEATEDRIEDLLPRGSISPQTALVLTNAIFFMASWEQQFDPANTSEGTFTALDGSESTVPLMRQNIRTPYADFEGGQAVELPYVGGDVSMVLIRPEEGNFEAFEQSLTAEGLFGIFDALGDARGDLVLPKFEVETALQLSGPLSELGMASAFGAEANFAGMVEGDSAGLAIDEVYHDAFVTVDEEGTEAAAATAVVVDESAPPTWGELRFDQPFLFCIRDRPTDAVLFLGRVVDAGQARPE